MANSYLVTWSVDIFDADTPEEAARLALGAMSAVDPTDPGGANVFFVTDRATDVETIVDLGAAR